MTTNNNAVNAQGANTEVINNDAQIQTINVVNTETTNESAAAIPNKYKNAIKELLAAGGKQIKGIKVKNAIATEKDNYVMVSFTLGQDVEGYAADANGIFAPAERNIIFSSIFAICGMLKEDDELSWISNHLLTHPNIINLLFNGGLIDIIQLPVSAGQVYRNPFSTRTDNETTFDHDTIINHVIGVKFGKTGQKVADKLMDKLLGF